MLRFLKIICLSFICLITLSGCSSKQEKMGQMETNQLDQSETGDKTVKKESENTGEEMLDLSNAFNNINVEVNRAVEEKLADIVLIFNLDRICRSAVGTVQYWEYLGQHGVRLHTVSEGEVDLTWNHEIFANLKAIMW